MSKKGINTNKGTSYISCLSEEVKDVLGQGVPGFSEIAEEIPTCPVGKDFEVVEKTKVGKGKKKRAPSAYNKFMGECVKEKGPGTPVQERFKACALEWKEKKK